MAGALEHLHPVKDVAAFPVFCCVVEFGDPAGKIHPYGPVTTIERGPGA